MNSHVSLTRREALKTLGAAGLGMLVAKAGVVAGAAEKAASLAPQPFTLPALEFAYDALEPHIDARTMEIHHTKHHQAYITNANKALATQPALQHLTGEEILGNLATLPDAVRTTLRNNVGGHVNHTFFWRVLGPNAGGAPTGALADAIAQTFGSFDAFRTRFTAAAMGRFGSGWAWLTAKDGKLAIASTANQDSPLSEGATPLLGLDVWEHAYYLKYQNQRASYVAAFWNVVRWDRVGEYFAAAV